MPSKERDFFMGNHNLQSAKKAKYDEFYTLPEPIKDELIHYTVPINQFENKTVICNADDPEWSEFWKYFVANFERLHLKRLISTHYEKGKRSYMLEYIGEKDAENHAVYIKEELSGDGDFRSKECLELLNEADIVVTNPPFSLFREYIETLIRYKKQFLVLGNMNALKYKDIFPYIKERKLWLGVHNGSMEFRVPDDFEKNNVYQKEEVKYAKFGNICWYTNMEHDKMHDFLPLKEVYDPSRYPKYDTFDAIEVGTLKRIPSDYDGIMGVPITIVQHLNPNQFEIVGEFNHGCDNEYDLAKPVLNGKLLFPRIAVRLK